MQISILQQAGLGPALGLHLPEDLCSGSPGSELRNERKKIDDAAAVLRCVLENAAAIFGEDEAYGMSQWEDRYGNMTSVPCWI
jgi:hypothetical protein